ncbi:glycerophosphodiester phosphodiesterase [Stutzerimonas tarimensis]|uniref:Glycerophosphodiester phosphodiesterase n=1 Tax=Stutzerimonas tarimensis TaxID=1507735 RepID=A0ABV7T2J4_9GAMM
MTRLYGHRGARGEVPENTLASFQYCLEQGVRRCELDLHLSRDGELMVIHDPTLERTTGVPGKVGDWDADALVALDARAAGPAWPAPCPVPRLDELFQRCDFKHWQLEVKSASRTRARATVLKILECVRTHGLSERVTVTSSSAQVLKALSELTPELACGLVAERWEGALERAAAHGCHLLALKKSLCTRENLAAAQAQGLHVSVWTVNSESEWRALAAMGVDSLITDYPSRARQVLDPQ